MQVGCYSIYLVLPPDPRRCSSFLWMGVAKLRDAVTEVGVSTISIYAADAAAKIVWCKVDMPLQQSIGDVELPKSRGK